MEQIFRVGDTVYHWESGKGTVKQINLNSKYPVVVKFESNSELYSFTINGSEFAKGKPSLSHTPYDLVNGGFSQRKSLPDIKKGTPIFVRDFITDDWSIRVFSHFDKEGFVHTFYYTHLSGDTMKWNTYSLENPINYEE